MEAAVQQDLPLGVSRVISGTFDQAIDSVTAALKQQGFGILSDIDVAATLKDRIGAEMEPYRILGACNPNLAHQALTADRAIGVLLPCNVVVRQVAAGQVEVTIADPETLFSLAPEGPRRDIEHLPGEARARLVAALDALA